jgi:hypothetical protein
LFFLFHAGEIDNAPGGILSPPTLVLVTCTLSVREFFHAVFGGQEKKNSSVILVRWYALVCNPGIRLFKYKNFDTSLIDLGNLESLFKLSLVIPFNKEC